MQFAVKPQNCVKDESYPSVKKIVSLSISKGLFTGSRKFGLEHDKSDYDFVVPPALIDEYLIVQNLKNYNKDSKLPTWCMYIELDNKKFNLLVTRNMFEYEAWVKSTNDFVAMLENKVFKEIMKDKNLRVSFFEQLRKYNGIGDRL